VRELYGNTMWVIRSPRGRYTEELVEQGLVRLGWGEVAPHLSDAETPQDFYAAVRRCAPHLKRLQVVIAGRQLYKFFREMKVGDLMITYDSEWRTYHVGVITGDAQTDPNCVPRLANFRTVEWRHRVPRDKLSDAARMSLSCQLHLFQPSRRAAQEIEQLISEPSIVPAADPVPTGGADPNGSLVNAQATARESIKERMMQLTWMEMQALVAGLLRAMAAGE
jgi:restriction system protein